MEPAMHTAMDTAIVWPALVVVVQTFVIYVLMFRARVALVKAGRQRVNDFQTYENEVPESRVYARAVANQFESPVLFYFLVLAALVTGTGDVGMVALAWAYALARIVHSWIHLTTNRIRHRMPAFWAGFIVLMLMTLWLALRLAGVA